MKLKFSRRNNNLSYASKMNLGWMDNSWKLSILPRFVPFGLKRLNIEKTDLCTRIVVSEKMSVRHDWQLHWKFWTKAQPSPCLPPMQITDHHPQLITMNHATHQRHWGKTKEVCQLERCLQCQAPITPPSLWSHWSKLPQCNQHQESLSRVTQWNI